MMRRGTGRVSRRAFLQRAAVGGGGLVLAGLGAACGSSSAATPTAAANTGVTAAATAPAAAQTQATTTVIAAPAGSASPAATAAASPAPTTVARKKGGTFVFAEDSEPDTLDIHKTSLSTADVLGGSIVEPLVYQNPDTSTFDPYLATKWEASTDGLSWTFTLRKDVVFHDGTPFNAQAAKRSFDRIMDPKTASGRALTLLGGKLLKGVDAPDDATVVFHYDKAFGPFLAGLTTTFCGIFSPAALDKSGDGIGQSPVGTGPFKFKEWVKGQSITLEPFDKYNWAPASMGMSGPPVIDGFVWRGITEATTRQVALEKGEAQMIRVPYSSFKKIKDEGYQLVQLNNPGMPQAIYMNTEKAPLDDKNVRLAVAHAIDRDAVIKAPFLGGAVWAEYAPLTKGILGYDPNLAQSVGVLYDQKKSKDLLDQAGWKAGSDGIRAKDGQKLSLTLIGTSGGKDVTEVTQLLLKAIGIDVNIQLLDAAAWKKAVSGGEHHLTWRADTGTDPDILYLAVHTSAIGQTNYVRAQNHDLDALLDQGRTTIDEGQRADIYKRAQTIILSEAYIVPVYNSVRVYANPKELQGVVFNDRAGVIPYGAWFNK